MCKTVLMYKNRAKRLCCLDDRLSYGTTPTIPLFLVGKWSLEIRMKSIQLYVDMGIRLLCKLTTLSDSFT